MQNVCQRYAPVMLWSVLSNADCLPPPPGWRLGTGSVHPACRRRPGRRNTGLRTAATACRGGGNVRLWASSPLRRRGRGRRCVPATAIFFVTYSANRLNSANRRFYFFAEIGGWGGRGARLRCVCMAGSGDWWGMWAFSHY